MQKNNDAIGYLVWMKLGYKQAAATGLEPLLERDLAGARDPLSKELHRKKSEVDDTIENLLQRGIRHIRTGLSWAEWELPGGRAWIRWYLRRMSARLCVLPCLTFTPPPLGERMMTNAPPKQLFAYAHFVHDVLRDLGDCFAEVELWNEWNLDTDWDSTLDPGFRKFQTMLAMGALVARAFGKETVFGGAAGVNPQSLAHWRQFARRGFMRFFDVVGFHNLRGTWGDKVPSPPIPDQIRSIRQALEGPQDTRALLEDIRQSAQEAPRGVRTLVRDGLARLPQQKKHLPVWLTEYGFPVADPTRQYDLAYLADIQVALFAYATQLVRAGSLERLYWYTLKDQVAPSLRFATTGWEDVLQYYYGDMQEDGQLRPLAKLLLKGGPAYVLRYAQAHDLLRLVNRASLNRDLPAGYRSNSKR